MYLTFKNQKERDFVYEKILEYGGEIETEGSLVKYTTDWV